MVTHVQRVALREYGRRVREARRAYPGITEPGLAPQMQWLLGELLPTLPAAPVLAIVPEFANPGVGRPDIGLKRAGAPARGFIDH